ncbi:MAG: response regulator [Bacteroidetes bacterium]|jgi:DNA-binding response OmpR family regulator|nr:response regulator [Bacteroidota bacterium]
MKTILLIEDKYEIRETIAEILCLANFKVLTAGNGESGLEIAITGNPDLILCDIMMPVLDGFGVYNALNALPYTKNIPFIFLTGKCDVDDRVKGLKAGVDDYLTKPIDSQVLLSTIELRISKYEENREKIEAERNEFVNAIKQMQNLTSHGVRKPIANCMGLIQLLDPKNRMKLSHEEQKKFLDSFKPCILELDEFIKELTLFMHSEQIKNRVLSKKR